MNSASIEAVLPLESRSVELLWGGHALVQRYGKPGDAQARIGESWECYETNRIASGAFAGRSVADVRTAFGPALLGAAAGYAIFPLLTKFIDARHALSVQVHPDDAYAHRVEGQPFGKAECWHVLEADDDASIVLGWNRATSRGEFLERVVDGSLDALLRRVPVKAGDTFFLPAGTLHAIGHGIVLYETQQASDLTYRVYDYDRVDAHGKKRSLHVEKAADVLDFRAGSGGALAPLAYSLDGVEHTALVADTRFVLERVVFDDVRRGLDLDDVPAVITALDVPLELETRGMAITLLPYQTALVPAAVEVVMCRSLGSTRAAALVSAPPRDARALERRFSRASVPFETSTEFFAQFTSR
jgi:mannose-6-phosphate isomerase